MKKIQKMESDGTFKINENGYSYFEPTGGIKAQDVQMEEDLPLEDPQ